MISTLFPQILVLGVILSQHTGLLLSKHCHQWKNDCNIRDKGYLKRTYVFDYSQTFCDPILIIHRYTKGFTITWQTDAEWCGQTDYWYVDSHCSSNSDFNSKESPSLENDVSNMEGYIGFQIIKLILTMLDLIDSVKYMRQAQERGRDLECWITAYRQWKN